MRLIVGREATSRLVGAGGGPLSFLSAAVAEVPALRYAVAVGGVAAVVSIVLTGWKLEPQAAVFGSLIVLIAMVVLVAFAFLSRSGPRVLRPLSLFLAWAFLAITVAVAVLFVGCAFFDKPKTLPCLLQGDCPDLDSHSTHPPPAASEAASAKRALEDLFAGRFQEVYERFAPGVRASISFAQFRATAKRELRQLPRVPLRRQLAFESQQAGFLLVAFDSEFDETSTWRELVTLVATPKGWELYALNIQPKSWSDATGRPVVFAESNPGGVLSRIERKEATAEDVEGSWIPAAGWRLRVAEVGSRRAEHSCDVSFLAAGTRVMAREVLGGCDLAVEEELLVVGRISAATADQIDIREVKFQPMRL